MEDRSARADETERKLLEGLVSREGSNLPLKKLLLDCDDELSLESTPEWFLLELRGVWMIEAAIFLAKLFLEV